MLQMPRAARSVEWRLIDSQNRYAATPRYRRARFCCLSTNSSRFDGRVRYAECGLGSARLAGGTGVIPSAPAAA
jgi:hypothetical protein